jgi:hypothetical protein
MRRRGPKGLEFARSVTEMKLLRNLQHVRERFGRMERRVVPYFVYEALSAYEAAYQEAFGKPLRPGGNAAASPAPAAAAATLRQHADNSMAESTPDVTRAPSHPRAR